MENRWFSLLAKAKIKQKGKVPLVEMACSIQKLSQEQLILIDFCTGSILIYLHGGKSARLLGVGPLDNERGATEW